MNLEVSLRPATAALLNSELDYFRAGSVCERTLQGELTIMPGFERIASGCVLHDIHAAQIRDWNEWLHAVESVFRQAGAALCRCYITDTGLSRALPDYTLGTEVGLVMTLAERPTVEQPPAISFQPIQSDAQLRLRKKLYQSDVKGPDGHDMQSGVWADLEQGKCEAGYMDSYLCYQQGELVGTVSLAMNKGFARLKNLFVSPECRGNGTARNIVLAAIALARVQGARSFGAYAVEHGSAHHLYRSCGMVDVLKQIELLKPL